MGQKTDGWQQKLNRGKNQANKKWAKKTDGWQLSFWGRLGLTTEADIADTSFFFPLILFKYNWVGIAWELGSLLGSDHPQVGDFLCKHLSRFNTSVNEWRKAARFLVSSFSFFVSTRPPAQLVLHKKGFNKKFSQKTCASWVFVHQVVKLTMIQATLPTGSVVCGMDWTQGFPGSDVQLLVNDVPNKSVAGWFQPKTGLSCPVKKCAQGAGWSQVDGNCTRTAPDPISKRQRWHFSVALVLKPSSLSPCSSFFKLTN